MTRLEQRTSPAPGGSSWEGSTKDIYTAAGVFIERFGGRPAQLVMSEEAYASLCRRLHLIAAPRLWGYRIRVVESGDDWRLTDSTGERFVSSTGEVAT